MTIPGRIVYTLGWCIFYTLASINPEKALILFIVLCTALGNAMSLYLLARYPRTRKILAEHIGEDWFATFNINPTGNQFRAGFLCVGVGVSIGAGMDIAQPVFNGAELYLADKIAAANKVRLDEAVREGMMVKKSPLRQALESLHDAPALGRGHPER